MEQTGRLLACSDWLLERRRVQKAFGRWDGSACRQIDDKKDGIDRGGAKIPCFTVR